MQRHFMKLGWMICAVFLAASVVPGVAQTAAPGKALSPLEQVLMASEKSLIEAKKKDDGGFFKRTLSEDFSLVGVDGKLLEGQEAVDDLGDAELVADRGLAADGGEYTRVLGGLDDRDR